LLEGAGREQQDGLLHRGWGAGRSDAAVRERASPAPQYLNMANQAVPEAVASFSRKSRSPRQTMVTSRSEV